MSVGYLVLYAAFVVVALWLVAELLLQNKAPLVWRAVALAGFLGVVGGMALGSVAVIGLGAAAFAVGQTFVTLSVKRGYQAGWSLRGPDGSLPGPLSRIPFLAGAVGGSLAEPPVAQVGEVGPVEPAYAPGPPAAEAEPPQQPAGQPVYAMQPLSEDDDSDGYGVYTGATTATQEGYYDASYAGYPQQDPYAAAYQGGYDQTQYSATAAYQGQQGYYDASYAGYPQQDPYAAAYQGGYDQTQYSPAATGYTDWSQQQSQPQPQPQPYADYGTQQYTVPEQQQPPEPPQPPQQPGGWQPSA
ncbi:hypothetical protein [Peterkaempfera bronchialis]|uniref:Uncharacterized protein n=1 Tax=Peterkaempfera bronchialis TaxID=2126346 RepID=A0A345STQ2_9ACTN|nr:hypothetical protein [Peterkaempfera bronchialis]AXI77107.1 hypothetical protein C7M71_006260 [Peterkaempfera bronchialis]